MTVRCVLCTFNLSTRSETSIIDLPYTTPRHRHHTAHPHTHRIIEIAHNAHMSAAHMNMI